MILDDYDQYMVHLIPKEGRMLHTSGLICWCKPKQDLEDPTVVIHNEEDYE